VNFVGKVLGMFDLTGETQRSPGESHAATYVPSPLAMTAKAMAAASIARKNA
jgi:hypothetical protein